MLRDSTEQVVWTTDLLVGDIVLLTQGDEVPADGLWLDGQTMVIDESALTGESDPFKKSAEKPSFFAGSLVTEHKGRMLVTAVGSNTTGGKIMELLNSVAKTATPLQEKLEKMAIDISKVTCTCTYIHTHRGRKGHREHCAQAPSPSPCPRVVHWPRPSLLLVSNALPLSRGVVRSPS